MPFAVAFDASWWKEQAVIWVVFSGLVSLLIFLLQLLLRWLDRRRYEDWSLITIGFDDPPQALYWEDVRRWLISPRDLWVMVKGTVSGVCHVTPRTVDDAVKAGWVRIDMALRQFIVDFTKIPDHHRAGGKWHEVPKGLAKAGVAHAPPIETAPPVHRI